MTAWCPCREASDPRALLKCINPHEASLVDAATALHDSFPPAVVYKIFTHAPVLDVGAFCPRAYAAETKPCTRKHLER